MLPDVVKTYKQSQGLTRLEVTSERTIGDGINEVLMANNMFSEIDKLLHLYFTIPVTIRTTERSFSCLRCIKNYLRSSMTEERLTEQCHSLACSQGGNRSPWPSVNCCSVNICKDRRLPFFIISTILCVLELQTVRWMGTFLLQVSYTVTDTVHAFCVFVNLMLEGYISPVDFLCMQWQTMCMHYMFVKNLQQRWLCMLHSGWLCIISRPGF